MAVLACVRGRTVRAVRALLETLRRAEGCSGSPAEEGGESQVSVRIPCPPAIAERWGLALELARRVAGEPLPVWACAEAIAAEVASALDPDAAAEPGEPAMRTGRAARPGLPSELGQRQLVWRDLDWRAVDARGEGEDTDAQKRSGIESLNPQQLDARLRERMAGFQALDVGTGRLLRHVRDRGLHRELGFARLDRYVEERLDMSPRTARRLIRLARAERREPEVASAFAQGALSGLKTGALLRAVASAPDCTRATWVERARELTLRQLERERAPPDTVGGHCVPGARGGRCPVQGSDPAPTPPKLARRRSL